MSDNITIAVSKGRILEQSLPLLAKLGIHPEEDPNSSRKLIFATSEPNIRLIIIRATDVPTYVEYGAADIGIAGKDVLMEYDGDGLYEPLDLGICKCRLSLAGPKQAQNSNGRLRIATKYVKTTRDYFATQGKQVEIIKLYGSMELAPVLGLADLIVDLVESGNTLKANGMVELEKIVDISSRLVVNKAAMKMKQSLIKPLITRLADIL
ncbi:MAG: ATP phosphoribosyltransferase [Gammaproteobacteria bacterium]|jgi:ATP phosphoribosyltransferase|nr:ATP phosphoribosyltransferase [Gammaproteobacteria bacterium]